MKKKRFFEVSAEEFFRNTDVTFTALQAVINRLDILIPPPDDEVSQLLQDVLRFIDVTTDNALPKNGKEAYVSLLNSIAHHIEILSKSKDHITNSLAVNYAEDCLVNQLEFIKTKNPHDIALKWFVDRENQLLVNLEQ